MTPPERAAVADSPRHGRLKVALLGAGYIGTDLLIKIRRSPWLNCTVVAGRNLAGDGLRQARAMGFAVTDGGIDALVNDRRDHYQLVFDATNALAHQTHWDLLRPLGKRVIDLTPSRAGFMVVPTVNGEDAPAHPNVNLISCGGQASIPILHALSRHFRGIRYIELVTTASSPSVGRATRLNLDEYVQTTESAIQAFTGVAQVKSLVNISPAQPPANFRVALSLLVDGVDPAAVTAVVTRAAAVVRSYAPGYRLCACTVLGGDRVFVTVEVQGRGDLLPTYAGNLDIINDAAVTVAEQHARARAALAIPAREMA
ncbi:MAG TPA: acetaldehyde dehydrogenase (acetylating) [Longimicrobium sp.]|nr:acetaldehyde dehydrogenase (acetylating) [Longimicrobium sp.]